MLRSMKHRSKEPVTPPPPFICSYHTFSDSLSEWEAFKSLSTLRTHSRTKRKGGGVEWRGDSLEVIKPPLGEARTTWSLLAPFTKPGRKGKIESAARGVREVGGIRGWKSPHARDSIWNNAGEWGTARLPGKEGSAPAGTQGPRPSRPTLGDQGPPGKKQRPPSPSAAGPARPRVPGLRGLGPWRLQPYAARVSRRAERLGPLSPWPPLGSRPGSGPPPLSGWPRQSPTTPLAQEAAPALGDGGGGGSSLGEGSSGTEPEEGPNGRKAKSEMAARAARGGGGDREGQWVEGARAAWAGGGGHRSRQSWRLRPGGDS